MKAWVFSTSCGKKSGKVMEADDLAALLADLDNGAFVVERPDATRHSESIEAGCDWMVEIYDDYRE